MRTKAVRAFEARTEAAAPKNLSVADAEFAKRVFAESSAGFVMIRHPNGRANIVSCLDGETPDEAAAAMEAEMVASSSAYEDLLQQLEALESVMDS